MQEWNDRRLPPRQAKIQSKFHAVHSPVHESSQIQSTGITLTHTVFRSSIYAAGLRCNSEWLEMIVVYHRVSPNFSPQSSPWVQSTSPVQSRVQVLHLPAVEE